MWKNRPLIWDSIVDVGEPIVDEGLLFDVRELIIDEGRLTFDMGGGVEN